MSLHRDEQTRRQGSTRSRILLSQKEMSISDSRLRQSKTRRRFPGHRTKSLMLRNASSQSILHAAFPESCTTPLLWRLVAAAFPSLRWSPVEEAAHYSPSSVCTPAAWRFRTSEPSPERMSSNGSCWAFRIITGSLHSPRGCHGTRSPTKQRRQYRGWFWRTAPVEKSA